MRVAIISSFPFPDGKATANRVAVFADQLVASRIADEVTILSTSSETSGTVAISKKIKSVSTKVSVIDKRRLLWRAVNEAFVSLNLWRKARHAKPEIIIVTIPSPLLLLPLIVLRKQGILVLDIRDAVWGYLGDQGRGYFLGRVLAHLFSIAAKKVDLISVTNGHEAKSVLAISNIMPLIVPNGISSAKLAEFSSIGLKEPSAKLNVTYVGNVGIALE